jgi:hypothetical protein
LSSLKSFVDNGYGVFALAVGGNAGDGIPQADSLAKTEKGKSIVDLVGAMALLGRLTAAPPGVPEDRLAELRAGYKQALSDPDLLAEASKLDIPIEPAFGEDVARMVNNALNQSPETVKIIAAAVNVEIPLITVKTPLLSVGDGGKEIGFKSGDEDIEAKVSGSRTKIKINGADANRKALKVGMVCEIAYDPQNEDNEPKTMGCES